MLLHLHIRNFAIVPSLEQDFLPGFTAISGETGAGKSILVDALSLLLGARSDSSWVRGGADRAELNAEFSLAEHSPARHWLREHELTDGEQCLLRRTIPANGRSRAWVNGTPVTIGQLAELGNLLVEVHGQNEHVRLASPGAQRDLLDRTGSYTEELEAVATAFVAWREAQARLQESAEGAALAPSEVEFARFQLEELEQEDLSPDAIAALEQEHCLLASSGELLEALERCDRLLDDDGDGAGARLNSALGALKAYGDLAPGLRDALSMLDEALINTREAAVAIAAVSSDVDLEPRRLQEVEATLSRLGDLARKHGMELEGLEEKRRTLTERLDHAERFDELRAGLEADVEDRRADYRASSKALHDARRKHGESLAGKVQALMKDLGMAGGRYRIEVDLDEGGEPGRRGNDTVRMLVTANAGTKPGPLGKVASGGELSRISLAVKVATADSGARTQVFDEIDTGVGGDTANAVGVLLGEAASGGQALCVTHLAQVAVQADQQLKVTKESARNDTSVDAAVLDEDARIEEIARMLGGKVSEQSRAHAREMLDAAGETRQ